MLLFTAVESEFKRDGDQLIAESTYRGKTTFNGGMNVLGGMAVINGDSEFNGPVTVYGYTADAQLDVSAGNHVAADGALNFRGEDGGKVVLEKDVIVDGGRLYSIGDVEYRGNVLVTSAPDAPSFAMFTRTIMDDVVDGTATFGEDSVVQ
ncbi:MAG: hypothetical protein IJO46_07460, partial [Thermoguttaceae bacterium]|nr:hypothetical protein [Thermoguttaceae bacterium]